MFSAFIQGSCTLLKYTFSIEQIFLLLILSLLWKCEMGIIIIFSLISWKLFKVLHVVISGELCCHFWGHFFSFKCLFNFFSWNITLFALPLLPSWPRSPPPTQLHILPLFLKHKQENQQNPKTITINVACTL